MDNDYNAALNSQHTRLPETHRPYSSENNVEPMWIFSCTHDLYKKEDNKLLRFKKMFSWIMLKDASYIFN